MWFSSLPVSLLRQWAFCPRIPWHREVAGRRPAEPKWVTQGRQWHIRQDELTRRRNYAALGLGELLNAHHNAKLKDNGLGLYGVTDLVLEFEHGLAVVEFKIGDIVNRGARLQASAYGFLAETEFSQRCPAVFVAAGYSAKRYHRIILDDKARDALDTAIAGFKRDIGSPKIPDSSASSVKCEQCEYLAWCNDRF